MAIMQPAEMDFSNKKFSMIISGSPGIGKTTLALSAPNPILIDFDRGISRVRAQHRKLTSVISTYEELLQDIQTPEFRACETVIIDTGGSFVTYLQDWAMRQDSANRQKNGSISMKGFGAVKAEFVRFTNQLKDVLNKNIIYIFHTQEEKTKDGSIVQRLLCEGSARNIVWQPCDLGCFMYVVNNERQLGFTPTDEYFAKGCFGISGIKKVQTLQDSTPNDYLTKLFEYARETIAAEGKVFEAERAEYDAVMAVINELIDSVVDCKTATDTAKKLGELKHVLTSKLEGAAIFKGKIAELGIKWNKEKKAYEQIQDDTESAE